MAKSSGVITLRLAPVDLELLGVQVTTSYIGPDVGIPTASSIPALAIADQ